MQGQNKLINLHPSLTISFTKFSMNELIIEQVNAFTRKVSSKTKRFLF
jgi:hypothetical protein